MTHPNIRILSIIPYKIFPAKLGGEKGIAVFNEYLCRQAHLTAITIRDNDPIYANGYRVINSITNSKWRYANLFLYFRLRKLLKQDRSSHFLIEHPYFGWLGWLIRKTTKLQWVVHSHNIEYMRSQSIGRWWWKALKWYEGWVYRKADTVFFISEDDMAHAKKEWKIDAEKSIAVTYGIEQDKIPSVVEKKQAEILIRERHDIRDDCRILLFNGALYHSTNYDALKIILDEINPVLMARDIKYKIVVCGRGLPESFNGLSEYADKNIMYAGFVDDITPYFTVADVFLNPILSGGGVKTKAIEALAMDCKVVSTPLGAMGIRRDVCGDQLLVGEAGDWLHFTELVIRALANPSHTPTAFYDHYYWGNIIGRVVHTLSKHA